MYEYELAYVREDDSSQIRVFLNFKQSIIPHIVSVYIPCTLIVVIT